MKRNFRVVKPIKYLPKETIDTLISLISGPNQLRDKAMFTISFWRGLRASEISLLNFSDYDRKKKRLLVHRLKGSVTDIWYDLQNPEVRSLELYIKMDRGTVPGPLFLSKYSYCTTGKFANIDGNGNIKPKGVKRAYLDQLMKKYAPFAKIPKDLAHTHTLKHSICVYLLENDMNLVDVQDWAGHKSIATTQIYAKISDRKRRGIAETIARKLEIEEKEKSIKKS